MYGVKRGFESRRSRRLTPAPPADFWRWFSKKGRNEGLGWTATTRSWSSRTPPKVRLRNWRLALGSVSVDQNTAKSSSTLPARSGIAELKGEACEERGELLLDLLGGPIARFCSTQSQGVRAVANPAVELGLNRTVATCR